MTLPEQQRAARKIEYAKSLGYRVEITPWSHTCFLIAPNGERVTWERDGKVIVGTYTEERAWSHLPELEPMP